MPPAPTIAPALTPPQTPLDVPTVVSENVVPPSPCPTSSLEAEVVQDERWVVAGRDGEGRIHKVIWPSGYWARYGFAWVSLYDARGFEVAKTNRGEWLRLPGVPLDPDVWLTCGTIQHVTRETSSGPARSHDWTIPKRQLHRDRDRMTLVHAVHDSALRGRRASG